MKDGFITKVIYLVSNLILVKEHNGKWRVCIDFFNLNRAYLKDSFFLPRIDQLVNSTTKHEF